MNISSSFPDPTACSTFKSSSSIVNVVILIIFVVMLVLAYLIYKCCTDSGCIPATVTTELYMGQQKCLYAVQTQNHVCGPECYPNVNMIKTDADPKTCVKNLKMYIIIEMILGVLGAALTGYQTFNFFGNRNCIA